MKRCIQNKIEIILMFPIFLTTKAYKYSSFFIQANAIQFVHWQVWLGEVSFLGSRHSF